MAFSSWLSRLRSSSFFSRPRLSNLRNNPFSNQQMHQSDLTTAILANSGETHSPFAAWASSLLPVVIAVSAGALGLQSHNNNTALCDAPNLSDVRGVNYGGKGSTDYVVKGSHKPVSQQLIDELKAICHDNMTMDYDERYFHGKPQNSFHKAVNIPDVVVFPRSEEEVSKIVQSCNEHKVPIVPYGGATSIEGHTLSPNGGICIDMTLMKRVKALHVKDMDVVVEPGIGWMELNEYLEPYGLFFPLDPGPGATIGGMCATRCSGSLAVSM